MSQADSAHTTTLRPGARPGVPSPQRITARSLASEIRGAHAHLIARIAAVPPNMIDPFLQADDDDLQLRADHLRIVLRATAQYVGAFMRDTASFSHAVQIERKRLDSLFDDLISDLCGAIEQAAETVRDEEA